MELENVIRELKRTRGPIGSHRIPQGRGVYALFLKRGSELKGITTPDDGLIYIGSSENLAERGHENHFNSYCTGFSTLRRSLGAVMKEEAGLKAIPRSPGSSETNVRNYKFEPEGEKLLTTWMRDNLEIGFCLIFEDPEKAEKPLLSLLRPVLNLKGCDNSFRRHIMGLRKKCSAEARAYRVV